MNQKQLTNKEYQALLQGFKGWLKTLGYSASTIYNRPLFVKDFLYFQEEKKRLLKDWKGSHYRDYMSHCQSRKSEVRAGGLSAGTLNQIAYSLELFQQYLLQTKQGDFYTNLKRIKSHSKPLEILTKEQIQGLYQACPRTFVGIRQRAVLGLCYGCGLRSSEACQLELKDIWWEKQLLQVRRSKTKKSRLVPIASQVLEDFQDYLQAARPLIRTEKTSPYFLLTLRGNPMRHRLLYQHFQKQLEAIDFPPSGLHILRHSIASHLAHSGMESAQIAQFLGHQTLNSTQIYVHLNQKKNER